MKKNLCLLLFWMGTTFLLTAQNQSKEVSSVLAVNFSYSTHIAAGDLADRFGLHFKAGGGVDYLLKNNWSLGVDAGFIFGNRVDEDIFSTISPNGEFIGNSRLLADVQLRHRGFYLGGSVGKIIPLVDTNPHSGIRATIGLGLWQHRIRIQQDPQAFVPQVADSYAEGYDRLTNGLAITEFIGYQYMSNNRLVNFFFGVEMTQGFTKNRRDFNFDQRQRDDQSRTDLQFGFRLGWILPFYLGERAEDIFY
ncbi:MAG: hypothetical protein AAGD05_09335 [Bacteroidota bacterium]